jgi:hypothetical protein
LYAFTSRYLVTTLKNRYFTASVFTSLPAGDCLTTHSSVCLLNCFWPLPAQSFVASNVVK